MMTDRDNLGAWPSDQYTAKKFNIVEFYHQILWASQHIEEPSPTKTKRCRVTFSTEPPIIYEYEPEYSKTKSCFFDYQYFKRRFQQHHQQKQLPEKEYFYKAPPEEDEDEYNGDEYEAAAVVNHRLMKTRSLSEFRPIPNQQYDNSNKESSSPYYSTSFYDSVQVLPSAHINKFTTAEHNNSLSTLTPSITDNSSIGEEDDDNDPPPSYIEYNISSGNEAASTTSFQLFDKKISRNNASNNKSGGDSASTTTIKKKQDNGSVGRAFFQRTLRKIKSSPKLMVIQRRSSMISLRLRKKKSFPVGA